jgi:hypothetical protein
MKGIYVVMVCKGKQRLIKIKKYQGEGRKGKKSQLLFVYLFIVFFFFTNAGSHTCSSIFSECVSSTASSFPIFCLSMLDVELQTFEKMHPCGQEEKKKKVMKKLVG